MAVNNIQFNENVVSYTRIIAEAGVNHNGDIGLAHHLIDIAAAACVDVVKFQSFVATEVMTEDAPLAEYMGDKADNFLELANTLELDYKNIARLKIYAESLGLEFLSSPFDELSVDALEKMGLTELKIPSGETVNPFLLKAAAKTKLPLIVSTGMCDLEEVSWAVRYLKNHASGPITLLHCTTQYPADPENVNLEAINCLKRAFDLPVGYSDHCTGTDIAIAAVAMGATVIEKHFTSDKTLPGPDHAASLEPDELKEMVRSIRKIDTSIGTGIKKPFPIELELAKIVRKSLVIKKDSPKGTVINEQSVTAKRPGTGIPAREFCLYAGRKLKKDLPKNHLLCDDDLEV